MWFALLVYAIILVDIFCFSCTALILQSFSRISIARQFGHSFVCKSHTKNNYNQVPCLKSSSKGADDEPYVRRKHSNKYEKFSKKEVDPLDKAKSYQENIRLMENNNTVPQRGTTVPIYQNINISNNVTKSATQYRDIDPMDPYTFGFTRIGVIISAHGIKGEVKASMETDFAEYRMRPEQRLYVKHPDRRTPRPIALKSGRKLVKSFYLIHFLGSNSRRVAEAFKGYIIYVRNDDRPHLEKNEYLIRDITGCKCYLNFTETSSGIEYVGYIGVVHGVIPPSELCEPSKAHLMHSLLEIVKPGFMEEKFLVPFVPSIVTKVDVENKAVLICPPDGLLELTYTQEKKDIIYGALPERAKAVTEEQREIFKALYGA